MSREHLTPKATGWAYGLTEPAVIEVEDALRTLQWMWDYCDDIKRNHRSFGGTNMLMRQWSKALTVVEKMAAKYLDRGPVAPALKSAEEALVAALCQGDVCLPTLNAMQREALALVREARAWPSKPPAQGLEGANG